MSSQKKMYFHVILSEAWKYEDKISILWGSVLYFNIFFHGPCPKLNQEPVTKTLYNLYLNAAENFCKQIILKLMLLFYWSLDQKLIIRHNA